MINYNKTSHYDHKKIYLSDKEEEDIQSSRTSLRSGSIQPKSKVFF